MEVFWRRPQRYVKKIRLIAGKAPFGRVAPTNLMLIHSKKVFWGSLSL